MAAINLQDIANTSNDDRTVPQRIQALEAENIRLHNQIVKLQKQVRSLMFYAPITSPPVEGSSILSKESQGYSIPKEIQSAQQRQPNFSLTANCSHLENSGLLNGLIPGEIYYIQFTTDIDKDDLFVHHVTCKIRTTLPAKNDGDDVVLHTILNASNFNSFSAHSIVFKAPDIDPGRLRSCWLSIISSTPKVRIKNITVTRGTGIRRTEMYKGHMLTVDLSEEDKDYICLCNELPTLSAFGPTVDSALLEGKIATDLFILTMAEEKGWIPKTDHDPSILSMKAQKDAENSVKCGYGHILSEEDKALVRSSTVGDKVEFHCHDMIKIDRRLKGLVK